jgi:hypothetical protein
MIAARTGFSTELVGYLQVAGRRVPLGQLGPAHCIVRESLSAPPGNAEILVTVDGQESRLPVFLPEGITPNQTRVAYHALNSSPPNSSTDN